MPHLGQKRRAVAKPFVPGCAEFGLLEGYRAGHAACYLPW